MSKIPRSEQWLRGYDDNDMTLDAYRVMQELERELAEALKEKKFHHDWATTYMWERNDIRRELAEVTKQSNELLQAIEGYDTTEVNDPQWQRRVKNAVDNCRRGK